MIRNPILLLDADVLCHQAAYSSTTKIDWDDGYVTESYNPELLQVQIESHILRLRDEFKSAGVIICLSDRHSNFRKELWDGYKATRREKPVLWQQARDFIERGASTGSTVVQWPRLEGDDVIGILHTGVYKDRSIMVSIDKDMKTIPGYLYNPMKSDLGVVKITEEEADLFHMEQTLTGDPTDDYKGCPGVGPVKARKLLAGCQESRWSRVLEAFKSKGLSEESALLNARLARILRDGEYDRKRNTIKLWSPKNVSG